jgi:hypothetical protein
MRNSDLERESSAAVCAVFGVLVSLIFCGCDGMSGYSDELLYPAEISSVYVEMFDSQSFRRGVEYELSDALAKRIEAATPYKVISDRDRADSVISGRISSIGMSTLTSERETGRSLEREVEIRAAVSWKNLKTGEMLLNDMPVSGAASYSEWQEQSFEYASSLAANNLARRIVELMERQW